MAAVNEDWDSIDWAAAVGGWNGWTNELSMDYSPWYGLKSYLGTGDLSAHIYVHCPIIHDGLSWTVGIARSAPVTF